MTEFIQVVTATDTKEHALQIAQHLLDLRLTGCVQVSGPITSRYWWKGQIESAEEWHCLIKTAANRYADVEREIRALQHPYEEPEILAFPIVLGSTTYLEWLSQCIRQE